MLEQREGCSFLTSGQQLCWQLLLRRSEAGGGVGQLAPQEPLLEALR